MKLELRGVTKAFAEHTVLDRVDLHLADICALVLVGPSGGGKTTLLRLIGGLETPDCGDIVIGDQLLDFTDETSMREYRKHVGVVFQAYNLFPLSSHRMLEWWNIGTMECWVEHGLTFIRGPF